MAFTGKSTFTAGTNLPEIAEDVSDLVGIVSPWETPLLDAIGDAPSVAMSTRHEWFEDALLPNSDTINQGGLNDSGTNTTALTMSNASRFRVGDVVSPDGSDEVLLVTAVNTGTGVITVTRGYGASTKAALTNTQALKIVANAALEGADAADARFTSRARKSNYTQIFTATVQVSGSEAASRQLAVENELDYQKVMRLRELLRDLENTVVNGIAHDTAPQGSSAVRRTMRGILHTISSRIFRPGVGGFPSDTGLTEEELNAALRAIWEEANSRVDLIVVNGNQKRRINSFISSLRKYSADDTTLRNLVSTYESDFGVCKVVLSRNVPKDAVLLLDSSRLRVLPLAGRSFAFKPLANTGDYDGGEIIGEYTLEMLNESAHGAIRGLDA